MRDTLRNLGKNCLVSFTMLGQSFYSLILITFFSKWFLKPFKRGEREKCIILGNGPSLMSELRQVRELRPTYSLICVNSFPFSQLFDELKPEYYVFVDPYYWFLLEGQVPEHTERLFRSIDQKVTWPIVLVLPYEMESIVLADKGLQSNNFISVAYFNRAPVSGLRFIRFKLYDWYLGMPAPNNVLIAAIYLALRAAHKRILIFGADHSWHEQILITQDNVLRIKEDHFRYEKDSRSISDTEERYEPIYKFAYAKDGNREIFKIHEIFALYSNVHKAYWDLNDYANHLGIEVLNLTSKSYIDAFKRNNLIT
jgi:hypothetical protein